MGSVLRLQRMLRSLYSLPVLEQYLSQAGVRWKDFKGYVVGVTGRICDLVEQIYPTWVDHAVMHMAAEQVMRYLGRAGRVGINDAVVTDRRGRSEGVPVKHRLTRIR